MNSPTQIQGAATQTGSTNGGSVSAGALAGGGSWNPTGTLMLVTIPITSLSRANGNETYAMKVQDSADGGTTWIDRSVNRSTADEGLTSNGAHGTIYILASIKNPANVRFVTTLAGTSPSITFSNVLLSPIFTLIMQAIVQTVGGSLASLKPVAGSTQLSETIFDGPVGPGAARNLDLTALLPSVVALFPQSSQFFIGIAPTS